MKLSLALPLSALVLSVPLAAQESFGGASGADLSIEAIEPDDSPITIGKAGEYPADIGRYLLASGAGSAALSPDGQTIAFTRDLTGQPELWVMPAAGGQPRQVTFRTGIDGARWTPDGRLFYQADRDGNEQPGYFAISADGRQEREVLPAARGDFRIFGDFAEDGSFVYASTARNQLDFDTYRATLDGSSEMIMQGRYAMIPQSVSPDGRYAILTEAVGEDADNLYLLDLASKERRELSRPDPRGSHALGGFAWDADSSAFYFSSNVDREFGALTRYDLASGTREVLAEAAGDIGEIELCGAGGRFLAYTVNVDGFHHLHLYDRTATEWLQPPNLPEGVLDLDCASSSARLMVRVNGWNTPGDIWMVDIVALTAERVFAASLAGLDPGRFVRPQVVRYPASDGVELQGLLYLPEGAGRGADAPPVLFAVHGGPSGQSQAGFNAVIQYHVNRGLAVFAPNIRGSVGLGRTYSTLDDREKRLDSIRDLVELLAALGADGLVDADRAAVMGGSYGGYAVNAVLAAYPGAFKAGVSLFGVADWVAALEIASPALKASDRIEYGDITEAYWKEFYRENSPIRQADRIRVPVLYSHGVMDPRIDIAETETMVKTLRANGVDAQFVRIPDEGHGWRKLSNQLFYYRRQAGFIEEKLGL